MKYKEILLKPNLDKQNSAWCLNAAADQLVQLGMTPLLEQEYAPYMNQPGCVLGELPQLLERCHLILPIGGDGTILQCVPQAIQVDKPILGINTGRVGFLTQMESSELDKLDRLAQDDIPVEERMLLEAVLIGEDGEQRCHTVLNDIVIHHDQNKLADLMVFSGTRQIACHRANGIIFATPTGSTAYSLSAGGSIADPTLSVLLMTAICPYSAYNRSYILPADKEYTVGADADSALHLSFDGQQRESITHNQTLRVRKSKQRVQFLDIGLRDFYSNLYDKLSLRR